jgi:hypothetical protein
MLGRNIGVGAYMCKSKFDGNDRYATRQFITGKAYANEICIMGADGLDWPADGVNESILGK